jgi:hypothetical protein
MSLEFKLAIEGNLADAYKAEVDAGERACTAAMRTVVDRGKSMIRGQITAAGLGQRVANAYRANVYPRDQSLNAAGFLYTKARKIMESAVEAKTLHSIKGRALAIPTSAVPKSIQGKHPTPALVEQALGIRLREVWPRGKKFGFLVADNARVTRGGKGRAASRTAIAKGNVATVVMFILSTQVRTKKRVSIESVEEQMTNDLPDEIIREWNRLAA